MNKDQDIPLNDFPEANKSEWEALAAKLLNGLPVKDALSFTTLDGMIVDGLSVDDGDTPAPLPLKRASADGWDIRAEYRLDDPKAANEAILTDLERGVTSLHIHLNNDNASPGDLDRALDGVMLDLAPVFIEGDARLLPDLWRRRGLSADKAPGALSCDPLSGDMEISKVTARDYPLVTSVLVDSLPYHSKGASDVIELACAIASGLAFLRRAGAAGLSPGQAARQIVFRFAVDANFFQQMAKLRAARFLWAKILRECAVDFTEASMNIWAVTSPRIMTKRDPYVNMLRGAGACFAAQAGGADTITVLPFTHALGEPDGFARRMARNIQVILQEESGLGHVSDPAAGSFAIEALTGKMAKTAWTLFQTIEAAGGMAGWLAAGKADQAIASLREQRNRDIARRKQPIIGVSEYPNLAEKPVATTGKPPDGGLAAPFEALRDLSDAWLEKTGKRPCIFLANLGKPAAHTPRAMFAKNFFEAGGIEALPFDGTLDADDMAAAWRESGTELAVICGADAQYEQHLTAMAAALKAAGVKRLYKAGKPDNDPADIDAHIYIGVNVVAELQAALKMLGVLS